MDPLVLDIFVLWTTSVANWINFSLSPANRSISLSLVLILLVLSSIYVRWYINYTDNSQIPVRLSAIKSWIAPNFLPTNEAKSGVILKCHTHPDSSHKKGAYVLMTFLYLWYLSFCILFYISGAFCSCGLKSVLHIYALFLFLKMILKPDKDRKPECPYGQKPKSENNKLWQSWVVFMHYTSKII